MGRFTWFSRSVLAAALVSICLLLGCPEGLSPFGTGLSSQTVLTSSSLSGAAGSSQAAPVTDSADGLLVTPDNATGKVLSLLFATDDQEDEGVVIFGDGRPDIAPAGATLYDFDLSAALAVAGTASLKPGFVGGQSSQMVLLFGYIDVFFTLNEEQRVVRIAMADVEGMVRGDVLLKNTATDDFEWYDTGSSSFVSTRPSSPVVIETIRDFTDPIRPQLVFYPLNVELTTPVPLEATALADSAGLEATVDFVLTQAVIIQGQHDQAAIDDATLIQNFNLTQSAFGWGDSGLQADATLTLIP